MSQLVAEERERIKKIILTLYPPAYYRSETTVKVEVECNPNTAKEWYEKGPRPYQFSDETIRYKKTHYFFHVKIVKKLP